MLTFNGVTKCSLFFGLLVLQCKCVNAQDGRLSLGVGGVLTETPYKGVDNQNIVFPAINYDGDLFYFHGVSAGIWLVKSENDKLSLLTYYLPLHYDARDNSYSSLRKINNRHGSLMGGVSYEHSSQFGTLSSSLTGDYLDNNNGLLWDAAWSYPVNIQALQLIPSVGAVWSSRNFNKYYYGISSSESIRSGLSDYAPGSSWTPYAQLGSVYSFNDNLSLFVSARYDLLPDTITNSPVVAKQDTFNFAFGINWTFI